MRRWLGLAGSWAFLIFALAVSGLASTAAWMNVREQRQLNRLEQFDRLMAEKMSEELSALESSRQEKSQAVLTLSHQIATADQEIVDLRDSEQTILVSTAENKVYVRRNGETIFDAVCSTGKGDVMIDGRRWSFSTPIGKFKVISKEENPVWVPPDWHYLEEAKKAGTRVVRLGYGQSIDADTGGPVRRARNDGVWSVIGSTDGTRRVMTVRNNSVVILEGGSARELPPGRLITAGGALVIPPVGTPQRRFDKVLGSHRLNLGDGYALHGTQQTSQLGRSVSHGCIRLGDADIRRLYEISSVGDQVIIY
jgi:hypothetical protein